MQKEDRARIILGQVRSLMRSRGVTAQRDGPYDNSDILFTKVDGRWQASIQRDAAVTGQDPGADAWNLLNVEAGGARKLAVRFRDNDVRIIAFEPGAWETWFHTYDPTDVEVVRP